MANMSAAGSFDVPWLTNLHRWGNCGGMVEKAPMSGKAHKSPRLSLDVAEALTTRMKHTLKRAVSQPWGALVIVLLIGALSSPRLAAAGDPQSGMRVHRDPETGIFVPPPPAPESARARGSGSAETEAEDLVEVPAPSRGGGYMIDLRRRVFSRMTSRRESDGSVRAECRTGSPESTSGP
jgi:hypothetical protein